MDDFINVNKKDPQVQIKINDMLVKYNRLSYNYQSKIGHDTSIQNVFLKEFINIKGATMEDIDIEVILKYISRKHLESG